MPIGCLISFDNNPQGVYYAGQELSGTVDFNVDINRRIKGKYYDDVDDYSVEKTYDSFSSST